MFAPHSNRTRAPEDQATRIEDLRLQAEYWLDEGRPPMAPDRQCLHWPLEFPEVFVDRDRPGFDAVVGNPPFQGGKRISGPYGTTYREHLVKAIADGRTGNADLVTYFFLRGAQLVRAGREHRSSPRTPSPRGHPRGWPRLADGQRVVHPPSRKESTMARRRHARGRTGRGSTKAWAWNRDSGRQASKDHH